MNQVRINESQTGLVVSGEICFDNVITIRCQGNDIISNIVNADIEIDWSNVTSSDVSGLSLLLRWIHYAAEQDKQIHYTSIPQSLLKVATVCGIARLIGVS